MEPLAPAPALAPEAAVPPDGGGVFSTIGDLLLALLGALWSAFAWVVEGLVYLGGGFKQGLRAVWLFLGDLLSPALDPIGALLSEHTPVLAKYGPKLLDGLWTTTELVTLSLLIGGLLAIPVAFALVARIAPLRWLATAYIFFFRGTPLLAQIFLIYYGSGQFRGFFEQAGLWGVFSEAYWCALIAFSLNTAAYTGEILRGGILGVPPGEIEAAKALGMNRWLILRRVVLPGAYRIALPAYGNEIVLMIKASAVAMVVTILDLMGQTKRAYAQSFSLDVYLYAAAIYLFLNWALSRAWKALEDWMNPQRRPPAHAAEKK
ncbi:ABC transporter permease [Zavarzinia compransoris]|uniref:ABC transporter permease n=1 Tax=Zavarzinia compransoris TaxID=1264899 RepID=UPI0010CED4C8|nr:ABC transporter permease [Zavarzinia compransoris]TDP49282.1 polar amino acid transport system permease protein [Zavarzinia compransoris]